MGIIFERVIIGRETVAYLAEVVFLWFWIFLKIKCAFLGQLNNLNHR